MPQPRFQDPKRLRRGLIGFFLALAIPTAGLVWLAWNQLQFETFFQYRNRAEALTMAMDARLRSGAASLARHGPEAFRFFGPSTDGARVLERSPLAALPPPGEIPGLLGYFELDPSGRFGSPLLPATEAEAERAALVGAELERRQALAASLRQILSGNRIDPAVSSSSPRVGANERSEAEPQSARETDAVASRRQRADADFADEAYRNRRVPAAREPARDDRGAAPGELLEQALQSLVVTEPPQAAEEAVADEESPAASLGKLGDLQLDRALQQKSERLEQRSTDSKRPAELEEAQGERTAMQPPESPAAALGAALDAFGGEFSPFRFGFLASGHGVLYRDVWLADGRHIQGALLDRQAFVDRALIEPFRDSALAGMSSLVIAYGDDVMRIVGDESSGGYPAVSSELEGSLLHRARLAAPFDSLELVFSIRELPRGPAATVLGWTAAVVALVLIAGLLATWRAGLQQIRLLRQQQDFVAAVSHELKTPLTSIRMYGEMLQSGWADDERKQQYYGYIAEESERLTRLIDNVLQLARMSRSDLQFDLRGVAVGSLADLLRENCAERVGLAGFSLELCCDDAVAATKVAVDTDCFLQIAINLIDNAMKFAGAADQRRVSCSFREGGDGDVVFAVRDYGPGIERRELDRVFELFYRAESGLSRDTAGTGIGLAIVSSLAKGMGGSVDVVNRQPGAEFRVRLPAAPGQVAAPRL